MNNLAFLFFPLEFRLKNTQLLFIEYQALCCSVNKTGTEFSCSNLNWEKHSKNVKSNTGHAALW